MSQVTPLLMNKLGAMMARQECHPAAPARGQIEWRRKFAFTRHGWPSAAHPDIDIPANPTPVLIANTLVPHFLHSEFCAREPFSPSAWSDRMKADESLRQALAFGRNGCAQRRPASIDRTLNGLISGTVRRLDVGDRQRLEALIGLKPGQMQRASVLGDPLRLLGALSKEAASHSARNVDDVDLSTKDRRRFQQGFLLPEPAAGRIDEPFLVLAAWALLRFRRLGARTSDLRRLTLALHRAARGGHAGFSRHDDLPLAHWCIDGLLFAGDEFDWDQFMASAGVGRQWALSVAGTVLAPLDSGGDADVIYMDARQIAARMRQMMLVLPTWRPPSEAVPGICRYVFGHESDAACERLERMRAWASRCESEGCFGAKLWSTMARDLTEFDVPGPLRAVLDVPHHR